MNIYNIYMHSVKKWKTYAPSIKLNRILPVPLTTHTPCDNPHHLSTSPASLSPEETTILILCSSLPYYYCTDVISLNDIWFHFACFWAFNFFSLNIMFLRFIHTDNYSCGSFISLLRCISLYEHNTIYLNILLLKDI